VFKSYNYFSYKVSMITGGGGTLKLFMYVHIIILYVNSSYSSEMSGSYR